MEASTQLETSLIGERGEYPASGPSVWAGMVIAPSLWALDLTLRYPLVEKACIAGGSQTLLHALSIAFFVGVVVCGIICYLDWRSVGVKVPSDGGGPIPRRQFVAAVGVLSSSLFALIVLAQGLPGFFYDPCIQ